MIMAKKGLKRKIKGKYGTLTALANEMGYHYQTLSRICGDNKIGTHRHTADKICYYLGEDFDDLFYTKMDDSCRYATLKANNNFRQVMYLRETSIVMLAEYTELTKDFIVKVIGRRSGVRSYTAKRIADALLVDVEEIFDLVEVE